MKEDGDKDFLSVEVLPPVSLSPCPPRPQIPLPLTPLEIEQRLSQLSQQSEDGKNNSPAETWE